ncbi:MAG: LLM class flavin-dependent oxidoreductase [Deltaproteobacteria bacterium]|nr:LLM class flavin-dependent oxidoreductase [Deltaproteobacteria bacterium]
MVRNFHGEFGVKFASQSASQYTVADSVRLAQLAQAKGFKQVWVNDNLGQRNLFVVLSAIAARVPIKIGTSIIVPYFRNPMDIADSLAALSELTDGREVSVGIARGELARAGQQVEMPKPVAIVRETVLALKALLVGETISFRHYPVSAAYHHILPEQEFRLAFAPAAPLRFYCGGHGPRILKFAGEAMDGVFFGDHLIPMARAYRLESILKISRDSAQAQTRTLVDVGEIDIAIARDRCRAYDFARPFAAHVLLRCEEMGFAADDFRAKSRTRGRLISTVPRLSVNRRPLP